MAAFAIFCPAYREQINVRLGLGWLRDQAWCLENGHTLQACSASLSSIVAARNHGLNRAREMGADFVLMQDADVWPDFSGSALAPLYYTLVRHGAVLAGAAVPLRRGLPMNVAPSRPGEIYECEKVGFGLILLDVAKALEIEAPRFDVTYDDRGMIETGEDVFFCNRARSAGLKLVCNYTFPMAHGDDQPLSTRKQLNLPASPSAASARPSPT